MYTRVPVHIFDCKGFVGGIYTDMNVSLYWKSTNWLM